jgi:hypothetical protein
VQQKNQQRNQQGTFQFHPEAPILVQELPGAVMQGKGALAQKIPGGDRRMPELAKPRGYRRMGGRGTEPVFFGKDAEQEHEKPRQPDPGQAPEIKRGQENFPGVGIGRRNHIRLG